jgi:zona occludens toxin (predicted ATPase)
VIPQRLNFLCRRFGTLCIFQLHRSFEQPKGKNITFKTRRKVWNGNKVFCYFVVFATIFAAAVVIVIIPVIDDVFVSDDTGLMKYHSVSVGKQFRRFERS